MPQLTHASFRPLVVPLSPLFLCTAGVPWMDGGQHPLLCCRYSVLEDGSLHIPWAQVADMGRYTCMATNAVGSERQRIDLRVLGKPGGCC